jgi:hypothetical protein
MLFNSFHEKTPGTLYYKKYFSTRANDDKIWSLFCGILSAKAAGRSSGADLISDEHCNRKARETLVKETPVKSLERHSAVLECGSDQGLNLYLQALAINQSS